MKSAQTSQIRFSTPGNLRPRRRFIQTRLQNFGLSMIVMGASFLLYYLGLFGGVEGPLEPAKIGDTLASLGVSNYHVLGICLLFMVISLTWNHAYNACRSILYRNDTGSRPETVRKGPVSHFLWMMWLVFSAIVGYLAWIS
jgi:hypothetical protein